MKLRKRQTTKAVAGLLLVVLAACIAVFIRNALAQRNPENALPTMHVYYSSGKKVREPLASVHTRRDAYSWRFLFWTREGGGKDLTIWEEIEAAWVDPNALLEFEFSFKPKTVNISMSTGGSDFVQQAAPIKAPDTPGIYTYRIHANWGVGKDVVYYLKIRIPLW